MYLNTFHQSIKAIFGINFKMKTLVFLLVTITSTMAAPWFFSKTISKTGLSMPTHYTSSYGSMPTQYTTSSGYGTTGYGTTGMGSGTYYVAGTPMTNQYYSGYRTRTNRPYNYNNRRRYTSGSHTSGLTSAFLDYDSGSSWSSSGSFSF